MIHPSNLKDDEKLLFKRITEMSQRAELRQKNEFTFFLSPREQEIALVASANKGILFGGYGDAERKLLGLIGDSGNIQFPVAAVSIAHKKENKLDHRQVLGSLMSLGITRGNVGDIIPEYGSCKVVCLQASQRIILSEITKIGSVGVKMEPTDLNALVPHLTFEKITGTVSSTRLDNLVALFTKTSRTKCDMLFRLQKVQYNYTNAEKPSINFKETDVVSIKGYGKFIVDNIGTATKKGRYPIECRRYV